MILLTLKNHKAMKKFLFLTILLCFIAAISCSKEKEPEPDSHPYYPVIFMLNFAYIDDIGNDLLSNIYFDTKTGAITTIHYVDVQINGTERSTKTYLSKDFVYEIVIDGSKGYGAVKSTFNNILSVVRLDKPIPTPIDSTGIAKLTVKFPSQFHSRIDEIECHYRILKIPDGKIYTYTVRSFLEIEFDKILLNGVETKLRKVDSATGNITNEFASNFSEGTLVINPIK
jgi:hypothetical protein